MQHFDTDGYALARKAFPASDILAIHDELLKVGNTLDASACFSDLDSLWNHHKQNDRSKASAIYNGFKYLASIQRLASSGAMHQHLRSLCGIRLPALVDVNCRIDSQGEEKYLFGWHQDYWFSVCSPRAVVVWLPVTPLTSSTGGLQLMGNAHTDGRIFKTKPGGLYQSYADAVLLDEDLPPGPIVSVDEMDQGDALFFRFNVLHRSIPIESEDRSRFTVQLRFADYADTDFIHAKYRPGTVNSQVVDYINTENP